MAAFRTDTKCRLHRAASEFGGKAEDIYSGRVFRILTRCCGATQAGNPGVRRFLDRLRIASVANGNKNWLSDQPSQVVKWIADLFPLFAGAVWGGEQAVVLFAPIGPA